LPNGEKYLTCYFPPFNPIWHSSNNTALGTYFLFISPLHTAFMHIRWVLGGWFFSASQVPSEFPDFLSQGFPSLAFPGFPILFLRDFLLCFSNSINTLFTRKNLPESRARKYLNVFFAQWREILNLLFPSL
jgi:hypothetical protein